MNHIYNLGYVDIAANSATSGISNNLAFDTVGTPFPGDLWNIDPLFRNLSAGDYHLQSNSLAIDAGVFLSEVSNDFDGVPRPQGPRYDIGAYEFH